MQRSRPNEVYWRERAREAREQADNLIHPEAKRVMMEIAAGYQRMAQYAEERTAGKNSHKGK
jgi:hypothetical protein